MKKQQGNHSKGQTGRGKEGSLAGRMEKFVPLLMAVCFVVTGFWLLVGERNHFLLETALQTPFLTTRVFTADMLSQVGGGLFWVSSLLQSCLARPWLGSLLLLAVLMMLSFAVKSVFHLKGAWEGVAWLPSWMLLLNYLQLGYIIYLLKVPAVSFTLPVGLLLAVVLAGGAYKTVGVLTASGSHHTGKGMMKSFLLVLTALAMVVTVVVGYWLTGCYVLFACLLFAAGCFARIWHERRKGNGGAPWWGLMIAVLAVVLAVVVPPMMYRTGWFHMRADQIYTAGLPDYRWDSPEQSLFFPMLAAMVVLVVLAFFRKDGKADDRQRHSVLSSLVPVLLFIGAGVVTWVQTYRDSNFTAILEMKHAAEEGQWEDVLKTARENDEEPTRAQVCLTRLALYKLGRMGDELFSYPEGSAGYHALRPYHYLQVMVGRLLYYYYGKINFAYRWSMEDMVEYGMRPDYLRLMHRVALLNEEKVLADKYANALSHTLFYTGQEGLPAPKELLNYGNVLDGDAGLIEFYLLNSFALTDGGSREMVELSMMHNLITKNLNAFWPRFFKLLPTWQGKIPRHYQEAALMIAQLQGHPELLQNVPIDGDIQARFERLVQASAEHGDDQNYNRTMLKPEFGDTYWYYYFFVEGLKTT